MQICLSNTGDRLNILQVLVKLTAISPKIAPHRLWAIVYGPYSLCHRLRYFGLRAKIFIPNYLPT